MKRGCKNNYLYYNTKRGFLKHEKIVKYSMTNCSNCKKLSNILKINRLEVEEKELDEQTAKALNIMSVPVMIKFVDEVEVDRITGLVPVSKIKEFFND